MNALSNKKGTHTIKKNKLIKIIASISAMGTIGTGTAIGVSSCGRDQAIKVLTIGSTSELIRCSDGLITDLVRTDKQYDDLSIYVRNHGYDTIAFDSTITAIGDGVFNGCAILSDSTTATQITFEQTTITSIGESAFEGCVGITQINFAPSTTITSISEFAFDGCVNLTGLGDNAGTLTIAALGTAAFGRCVSLTVAGVSGIGEITGYNKVSTANGAYWIKTSKTDFYSSGCLAAGEIEMPFKSIGDYTFLACASITKIDLKHTGGAIGNGAFQDCMSLTTIISTGSSTAWSAIGASAFNHCESLKRIEFFSWSGGEDATNIGSDAFNGCANEGGSKVKGTNAANFISAVKAKDSTWFTNWSVDA